MEQISWKIDFNGEVLGSTLRGILQRISEKRDDWGFVESTTVVENGIAGGIIGLEPMREKCGIWIVAAYGEHHCRDIFMDRTYHSPLFLQTERDSSGGVKIPEFQRMLSSGTENINARLKSFSMIFKKELEKEHLS